MEKTEKKPVSIEAEHVSQLSCAGCRKILDVLHLPPFTKIKCPECGTKQIIPAKFDHFLLIKQFGAGGMGVIYWAIDRELGRKVALKVMKKSLGDNPEFVQSFKHEAQAAAALNHRNVAQIYSFGQYNGQPYIVMELVDGGKLDDLIAGGALDELKALEIHLEVVEGLMAAGDVGLVHGDVKPANILFGRNGEAKVVDFGLASYIGEQQQGGPVWGTPYYIAPEKARGKKIDFRSDIYSLGATLFHVLTGKPPFDGPTPNDVVIARLNQPAPNVRELKPGIHPETANMVARMLEIDPAMRYPSYPALLIDMRNALEAARKPLAKSLHVPIGVSLNVSETKLWLRRIDPKKAAIAGCGLLLAALVAAGWIGYGRRQARLNRETADRQLFDQSRKTVRTTWGRVINLTGLIIETGNGIAPLAEKADKIAASINRIDDPTALIMDETDKVKEWLNESEDLRADAAVFVRQLETAPDSQTAKRLGDEIGNVFDKLIAIHRSMQESGELAKEVFAQAGALQANALVEINRARAEKARIEADRRKVSVEKIQSEKKEDELKKMRPTIIQRELDIIEKCRGANALLIAQRRFDGAARSFSSVQSRITLDETLTVFRNVMETYAEIAKLKEWLCNAINKSPCKNCWIMGTSGRDVVKADGENGITVALGSAGSTMIQWEAVSVSQLLRMINYYAEAANLSGPQRAILFKQTALLCYESGVFKTAETYADAACKANPDLLADLNRLMPDIVAPEQ